MRRTEGMKKAIERIKVLKPGNLSEVALQWLTQKGCGGKNSRCNNGLKLRATMGARGVPEGREGEAEGQEKGHGETETDTKN
jgi:hypothetical protein